MPIIHDKEFGRITIRRSSAASSVRIRLAPDGTLRASLPLHAPLVLIKMLLKTSRPEIRKILNSAKPAYNYKDGMSIGKSHSLTIQSSFSKKSSVARHGQRIIVNLAETDSLDDPDLNRQIRDAIIAALKLEAKSYLPRRLSFLAQEHDFHYQKVRFSHSSSRWGSCSGNGTISLNIALMKLPFELIDYVIVHELSHTKQMNHGPEFWAIVATCNPNFKQHRKLLKTQNPSI